MFFSPQGAENYTLVRLWRIKQRKAKSKTFAKEFEKGYDNFRIGYLLKQARKKAGITQEELATKIYTKKSAKILDYQL